jgi:flagellar protein FlaI
MRPDRILVGEVRKKRQAEVLFEGMHTGHTVYSTLHADTAQQTVRRLTNPPIEVPEMMVEAVDLNLVMFRDRRRNFRRAMELAEIDLIEEEQEITANLIYEWDNREDEIQKKGHGRAIYETLKMHTGMTKEEIEDNLEEKRKTLQWMVDNDINDVDTVGHVVAEYYDDSDRVVEIVEDGGDPSQMIQRSEESPSQRDEMMERMREEYMELKEEEGKLTVSEPEEE